MKALYFAGSSQDDLKDFPAEARRAAGFELRAVQRGLMPSDFKPMPQVGRGVYELRVHVLHAFQKKTQKTRKEDLDLAARRFRDIAGEQA